MKFLEDEPNRLLKRCQTIYKALKSGTVKMDDGRVFEYDLIKPSFAIVGRKKWEVIVYYYPHGTHLQYDRTPRTLSIEDVDNYVDTVHSRLNVKITKDYGKPIPRETIKKKIQDKFRDFGIFLSYGEVKFKKMYTPEPIDNINEEVSNEKYSQIIKRLEKRALLIYNVLSEGHVMVKCYDGEWLNYKLLKLRYVLPENPRINIEDRFDDKDKIVEYGALMSGGPVKMYYSQQGFSGEIDWYDAVEPIKKKFKSLDIQIVFDGIDLIEEKPLNEEVGESEKLRLKRESEKLRLEKRIKKIFNALKSGMIEVVDNSGIYFEKSIKCEYKITSDPIIKVNGVFAKREDGYDRLDVNGNPILLRHKQTIQIYDVVVNHKLSKSSPDENHIFRELVKENIKNKFKHFDINCYIKDVYFSNENGELIDEAAFKNLQANKGISPEERQRIEKKVNVVMKAITKMPFTILEHKVKIKIPDYRMVVHPPNIIKFTNEFDQPEYQVTEPDVRIHADNALVYTDSEETYKYFIYEVKRDDFIYNVYHAIRNRLQKFNISFTLFDAPIRFENKDNDLQEQLDDFEPDEPDEFSPYGTESQKKKLRVIYKALKEGVIRVSYKFNFINCRYVLPNKVRALFDKKSGDIIIKMPKYGFELYDEDNVLINPKTDDKTILTTYHNAYRVISQRFQKHFGVMFEHTEDVYGDLQEEVVSELTDKERKKVRAIFTAFKTGVLDLEDDRLKIRYHLINEYWIKKSSNEGRLTIILKGNSFENVIIHKIHSDGTETLVKPNGNMWHSLFYYVRSKVEKIFKQYDIDIKLI